GGPTRELWRRRTTPIAFRVSALRASARFVGGALPRSYDRGYFLSAFLACVAAAVLLLVNSASAQQQPPYEGSASAKKTSATFDIEMKKRELEGQYTAAQESLAAVMQQLTNPSTSREDRARLELEEAKLR